MSIRPAGESPHLNGVSDINSVGCDSSIKGALELLSIEGPRCEPSPIGEAVDLTECMAIPHKSNAPVDDEKLEAALRIGKELQSQGIRGKVFASDHEGLCRNLFITDCLVFVHFNKSFQGDRIVGTGGMGKKFKFGLGSDGKKYVISSWLEDSKYFARLKNEIKIMEKLRGKPHLLQLVCQMEGASKKQPEKMKTYMVTPFCENGDLMDLIISKKKFSEVEKIRIILSILKGVKGMHEDEIIHRDLKPENVLFGEEVVVADFNLSEEISNLINTRRCGTYEYLAPEIICQTSNGVMPFTMQSDAYAVGLIMYGLKNGAFAPYTGNNIIKTRENLEKRGGKDWLAPRHDGSFDDVMAQLVRLNPQDRMSVTVAIAKLEALYKKLYDPLRDDDMVL